MSDQDRYLWDPTAPPDPEIQRLEALLQAEPCPPLDPEQVRRLVRKQLRTAAVGRDRRAAAVLDVVFGGNRLRLRWTGVALTLLAAGGAAAVGWAIHGALSSSPHPTGEVQRAGVLPDGALSRNNLMVTLDSAGHEAASMAHLVGTPQPTTFEILFVPLTAGPSTTSTAQVDLRLNAAWLSLPTAEPGVVLVEGQSSALRLSGAALVEPGVNLISLGGPGSRSAFDYAQLRSVYEASRRGPLLVASMPFDIVRDDSEHQPALVRSHLADGVGANYFDNLALYDGTHLLWSEAFENTPEGSYTSPPMRSIFPAPDIPMTPGGAVPQALAASFAGPEGGKQSLLSISVPGRARIDGVDLTRAQVSSGKLRYRASVYLNSADERGAIVGLKQEAGEPGRWYDKAAVLFVHGEIRAWSSDRLLGFYVPERWYDVDVTVDLAAHTMSVSIDGRAIADSLPIMGAGALAGEHKDWDEPKTWEGFDHFAFGGVFFPSPAPLDNSPLERVSASAHQLTYRLDGAKSGWHDTECDLKPGDQVELTATGEVLCALPGPAKTNPDGCQLLAPDPCAARTKASLRTPVAAPSAWLGSLVARIGDGPGFLVGQHLLLEADRAGRLSFAYNDSYFGDNQGSFTVTVTH